jgi:ribosomal subunit interface protein
MRVPAQITLRHIGPSDALEARIRTEITKLGEFYPDIVSCHVVVERQGLHRQQGSPFNVRIALHVPGHDLVVNRDHDEDAYIAVRDAFAHLTRRLEDIARRQRGDVKAHAVPPGEAGSGTVT